jgi:hypothetical protein
LTIVLMLLCAPLVAPARAQEHADAKTARIMETARQAIGPISPEQHRKACRAETKENEIIVCAPDDKEFRVKSSNELDPTSRQATRDGVPRAPDLAPKYGGSSVMRACLLPPCPPPAMYMIDLKALPETPPGSDAEKVGNGEMRRR